LSRSARIACRARFQNTGFTAEISSLATASRSKGKARLAAVTTDQSTIYQLTNSGRWFKASLKDQNTRRWIEEAIATGEDVYVVVGYQTMIDAVALGETIGSADFQAEVQLPVSEAASATGAVVMVGNLADPAVTIQRQGDHGLRKQLVAPGEQVYAVQYRKVKFKWYSSRDLDRAALEKGSRWMVHGTVRGQEVGTNDVVEATISEEEDSDGEEIVSPNQSDNS
jgi:hypothetical protein